MFLQEDPAYSEDYKAVKAFVNGVQLAPRGAVGVLRMLRDVNIAQHKAQDPSYVENEVGIATGEALQAAEQSSVLTPFNVKSKSQIGRFGLDLAQGAGQLASQIGITVLTGGAGGVAAMGASVAGNQYRDLREQGVDIETAAKYSALNAAIQAPLEQLGVGKILSKLPAGSPFRARALKILEGALTEGATEFIQQYPDEITSFIAQHQNKSNEEILRGIAENFGQYTKDAAYAGLIGAVVGWWRFYV